MVQLRSRPHTWQGDMATEWPRLTQGTHYWPRPSFAEEMYPGSLDFGVHRDPPVYVFFAMGIGSSGEATVSEETLRQRLTNANNHFRRKAAEVLGDEDAVMLLANLYQQSSINRGDLDVCPRGLALAKLTAANFCEIGATVVYITEAGQSFIESLDQE